MEILHVAYKLVPVNVLVERFKPTGKNAVVVTINNRAGRYIFLCE